MVGEDYIVALDWQLYTKGLFNVPSDQQLRSLRRGQEHLQCIQELSDITGAKWKAQKQVDSIYADSLCYRKSL